MNEVSKFCTELDHHPEWRLEGLTLKVNLTSHFRDNTVSEKDYQLAQEMNFVFKNLRNARPYAQFRTTHLIEFLVAIGLIGTFFLHRYYYHRLADVATDEPHPRVEGLHEKKEIDVERLKESNDQYKERALWHIRKSQGYIHEL